MTSKEALLFLATADRNTEIGDEAKKILWKLVERDTPKKPIKNTNHVIRQHNCSVCVCRLDIPQLREVNFCPKCGQRIDWSE